MSCSNSVKNEKKAIKSIKIPVKFSGTIHKEQDEFFIALAKKGGHSFIMLGVMQENKPVLLARVGKIVIDSDDCCKLSGKLLFTGAKAELQSESLHPKGEISYSAYAISYRQYLQFTKLMSFAQRGSISCYLPDSEDDTTATLKLKTIQKRELSPDNTEQERKIVEKTHHTTLSNTCRHTAIDLIEYTQGIRTLTNNVSRLFFRSLPLKTNFSYGVPQDHFYIFPLPPDAYPAEKEKKTILTKIYQRMENLLKKDPYGENTLAKFSALKQLYIQQAGIPMDDMEQALASIRTWKSMHQPVIEHLREQSFFGKLFVSVSSTKSMADEIEHLLEHRVKH
ncbi:hypothetical protein [Legionella oakridgensis]|uniref:Uncharacterized protein n=2 Tax=Legionella oakridgensis TaxID=29423 RepID=W0BGB6_9GAMM|nr:hypothetical protein [Legionella oakridgensis]AHE67736.1 hypothetical protein Loa_02194 [Legionella oakridgensis ATCC 33761 = DSM 21215]ETO92699.1 hypothetical protein LOR_40c04830 [Legionella oakridgensis RV-2-2007]KTD36934.1 hypothetical protein Loak_2070 [Legionella oakridgensis]STY20757.1 Uncharacterised protein [Legionella longbeachae]